MSHHQVQSGFHELVGIRVERMSGDEAVVSVTCGEEHLNGHGTVHGGLLASLADAAMGAAMAAGGQTPATVEMKVTYLEAAKPGRLEATARVRRRGSRITIVEAEIVGSDVTVAHAIATFTPIG